MSARLHLLTYDIANPARLRAVARVAEKNGVRLQYSVFITLLTKTGKRRLLEKLEKIIKEDEDDIRLYPLPTEPSWELHGHATWPQGMWLSIPWPEQPDAPESGEK